MGTAGEARYVTFWSVYVGYGQIKKEVIYLVYQWKLPGIYSVPAQTAGEELARIHEKRGSLTPVGIVDESRPEQAPLHPVFEWDDWKAAEEWRKQQAKQLVCCIVVKQENAKAEQVEVRAFEHVQGGYHPVQVILREPDMKLELMRDVLRMTDAYKEKLRSLIDVSNAVESAIEAIDVMSGVFRNEMSRQAGGQA